jgi:hypothetical protein
MISCNDSPWGLVTWTCQLRPTGIGQYGLSMFVLKSAGFRFDGSLLWGNVFVPDCPAAEELSFPDEPHPASAGSRAATHAIPAPARLIARASI